MTSNSRVHRVATLLLLLLLFSAAPPQADAQEEATQYSTTIVPLVGTIRGMGGVRWRSDVRIINETGAPVDAILMLPAAAEQPWMMTTIEPGAAVIFSDIAAEAFGLENVLSPLYVHAIGPRPLTVATMITGEGPDGAVTPQFARSNYGGSFVPRLTLTRLAYNDEYRTNIGLVNLDDTPATVTLGLQRVAGRNITTVTRTLPPNSILHLPLQDLFPLVTKGTDLVVVLDFSTPRAYGYASVLRNDDHSGIFIGP